MNISSKKERAKEILPGIVIIALLLVGVGTIFGQHNYILHLQEQLDLESPGEDYYLNGQISVFVMREGETSFDLAWSEPNTITNVGKNATRHHIGDDTWVNNNASTYAFKWLAIGTGSGGGAASTALQSEAFREIATFAVVQTQIGNFTLTYTFTAGTFSGEVITEAGLLNAAASGTLLNYQDFTGITLQSGDSLQVQFEFSIT